MIEPFIGSKNKLKEFTREFIHWRYNMKKGGKILGMYFPRIYRDCFLTEKMKNSKEK